MRKKIVVLIAAAFLLGTIVYYFIPEKKLSSGVEIDRIEVQKWNHSLSVFSGGRLVKTYIIAIGSGPKGAKEQEGDKRTPEGSYVIDSKNSGSEFYKNLGISYPNEQDRERAGKLSKRPGGDVKIHGLKNGQGFIGKFQRWRDWTTGCIALTDDEIDDLFAHVRVGTPIHIAP